MVYIDSNGEVHESRPLGLSTLTDFFWAVINFFALFFRSLLSPDADTKVASGGTDYRRGPPGGGPRRRMGGFGGRGGAPASAPPFAAGGG